MIGKHSSASGAAPPQTSGPSGSTMITHTRRLQLSNNQMEVSEGSTQTH